MALNKIVNDFIQSSGKSLTASGYIKLEDGLIIQWGVLSVNINLSAAYVNTPLTWPISFLTSVIGAFVVPNDGVQSNGFTNFEITPQNLNGGTMRVSSSSAIGVRQYKWIAIGY